jgi:hypothetical protein
MAWRIACRPLQTEHGQKEKPGIAPGVSPTSLFSCETLVCFSETNCRVKNVSAVEKKRLISFQALQETFHDTVETFQRLL